MDTTAKLDYLTGLRGWASLIVMFSHVMMVLFGNILGLTFPWVGHGIVSFLTDAPVAVYVFFVLSGFVLSIKFVRHPHDPTLPVAATSRYFRLVIPIVASSLLVYILMRLHCMYNAQAGSLLLDGNAPNAWLASFYQFKPSLKTFLSYSFFNSLFVNPDTLTVIYNPPLWTMPREFGGSMAIYFLLGVFKDKEGRHAFLPLVSALTAIVFAVLPSIGCFLAGYLLAHSYQKWHQKICAWRYIIFIDLIPLGIIVLAGYANLPGDHGSALFAMLMVAAVVFSPRLQKFFGCAVSRFLGQISFPLYLVHMTVIASFSSYLLVKLTHRGVDLQTTAYIVAGASMIASVAVAYAFTPVENYSVRASKQIAQKLLAIKLWNLASK